MHTGLPAPPERAQDTADTPPSVTDEELFEAYLAARLQQGVDVLNRAREELAAHPDDLNRAIQVMRRVHELRELRGQLDAQRARVDAAHTAAGTERQQEEPAPVDQATPGSAFRTAQSEQAARIMATLAAQPQTCPSCQALLAPNSSRCRCGHTAEPSSRGDPRTPGPFSAP